MKDKTKALWDKQNQHPGDRWRLFRAVAKAVSAQKVLYAGSYVDVAASFAFPNVTYVDMDKRANAFFDDREGVKEIIAAHEGAPASPKFSFVHGDYSKLDFTPQSFDLLISLYAGFISDSCTKFLKIGGQLLVNPSHGDAALASLNPQYQLGAVVQSRDADYKVSTQNLETYLQPKKPISLTRDMVFGAGKGIGYTKSPFAYLFTRVK